MHIRCTVHASASGSTSQHAVPTPSREKPPADWPLADCMLALLACSANLCCWPALLACPPALPCQPALLPRPATPAGLPSRLALPAALLPGHASLPFGLAPLTCPASLPSRLALLPGPASLPFCFALPPFTHLVEVTRPVGIHQSIGQLRKQLCRGSAAAARWRGEKASGVV